MAPSWQEEIRWLKMQQVNGIIVMSQKIYLYCWNATIGKSDVHNFITFFCELISSKPLLTSSRVITSYPYMYAVHLHTFFMCRNKRASHVWSTRNCDSCHVCPSIFSSLFFFLHLKPSASVFFWIAIIPIFFLWARNIYCILIVSLLSKRLFT